ncbi:MAG: thioesterase domain-containing protein [Alteromonadaceae bacterium]|jgi:thioesterase domain-containing protein
MTMSNALIVKNQQWCATLQQCWHQQIPISQAMGITAHHYHEGVFETRMPLAENINLHGTMFAGSIYSLATLTGWGLVYLLLCESDLAGDIVLKEGQIDYIEPLISMPVGIANVIDSEGSLTPLSQGNKARLKVSVTIRDSNNTVAYFSGLFVVLPHLKKHGD